MLPPIPPSPQVDTSAPTPDSTSNSGANASATGESFAKVLGKESAEANNSDAETAPEAKAETKPASKDEAPTTEVPAEPVPTVPVLVTPVIVPTIEVPVPTLPTVPVVDPNETAVLPTIVAPTAPTAPTTPTNAAIDIQITDPKTITGADKLAVDPTQSVANTTQVANNQPLPDPTDFSQQLVDTVKTEVATKIETLLPTEAKTAAIPADTTGITQAATKASLDMLSPVQHNQHLNGIADVKAAAAPAPTAPYTQVVSVVQPLRQQSDGNYQMTLQLRPEHLGKVEISVSLHNGEISMQLSSDNAASRQLLRDSMNDLRTSLQSSGLTTGSLDVGSGDTTDRQNLTTRNGSTTAASDDDMDDSEFFARLATVTSNRTSDGALDVRV